MYPDFLLDFWVFFADNISLAEDMILWLYAVTGSDYLLSSAVDVGIRSSGHRGQCRQYKSRWRYYL